MTKRFSIVCLVLLLCIFISSAVAAPSLKLAKGEIKMAWIPVWDCSPLLVAKDLGYFEDAGIKIKEVKTFSDVKPNVEALINGSVDLAGVNHFATPPLAATFSNMVYAWVGDLWWGFAFLARPSLKLNDVDYYIKQGMPLSEAVAKTANQFKGKTIVTQLGGDMEPIIMQALSKAGLTKNDVKFIDMPFPEGSTAFIRGEGDLYVGDIPSRWRVEETGARPVLRAKDLGRKAVMAIGYIFRKDWLKKNEDLALKIIGVHYRVSDFIKSDPDRALDVMRRYLNAETGSNFDLKFAKWISTEISPWQTFEEASNIFYNPDSEFNFQLMLQESIDYWVNSNQISKNQVKIDDLDKTKELYMKLVSLKKKSETNLSQINNILTKQKTVSKNIKDLVSQAHKVYSERNYVDAETISNYVLSQLK